MTHADTRLHRSSHAFSLRHASPLHVPAGRPHLSGAGRAPPAARTTPGQPPRCRPSSRTGATRSWSWPAHPTPASRPWALHRPCQSPGWSWYLPGTCALERQRERRVSAHGMQRKLRVLALPMDYLRHARTAPGRGMARQVGIAHRLAGCNSRAEVKGWLCHGIRKWLVPPEDVTTAPHL